MTDWMQHVEKLLPGIFGSMGAMLWIQGTLKRKLALFAFGGVASWYAAPWLSHVTAIPEGFAGLMVGLFGMSVIDSIFRAWQELGFSQLLREWLRARLGLPKE